MTTAPKSLQQLFDALKAGTVALDDNLPLFADEEWEPPAGGVWSWDATHMLEGTCVADLEIVARPAN